MIRSDMLGILLGREFRRMQRNPAALMLIGLLAAVAILIATSGPSATDNPLGLAGAKKHSATNVWIVYEEPFSKFAETIKADRQPDGYRVRLIRRRQVPVDRNGNLSLPPDDSYVVLSQADFEHLPDRRGMLVSTHYVGKKSSLDGFFEWFWPNIIWAASDFNLPVTQDWKQKTNRTTNAKSLTDQSVAELVNAELIGTVLLLIVQFFCCCHMLVSFTSQDRERGTLSSLVLSPASTAEIMLAKYIFHLVISVVGSVLIISILKPFALTQAAFWVVTLLTSIGLMCVGTCIATLARTQTSAGLLALCYMLAGAVIFYLATRFSAFALLKQLTFENYSFPILFRTLKSPFALTQATGLLNMCAIVGVWIVAARHCFYKYGWR